MLPVGAVVSNNPNQAWLATDPFGSTEAGQDGGAAVGSTIERRTETKGPRD